MTAGRPIPYVAADLVLGSSRSVGYNMRQCMDLRTPAGLEMTPELPQRLRGLLTPGAYPHPVDSIELVQTHISWVLLTGPFAYKIKRPVRYAFIDLSSSGRREFLCREELRLNQRFAPQLYLEVCPITAPAGEARIGGDGEAIEYAVKMRQFAREQELDRLLEAGTIAPQELENFGGELAAMHARLPTARRRVRVGHAGARARSRAGEPDAVRAGGRRLQ